MTSLYAQGNPAVNLYNRWLGLLDEQAVIDPQTIAARSGHGRYVDVSQMLTKVAYGSHWTGIGVHSFDQQQRPVLTYGGWYSAERGIYPYLILDADGNFRLYHPHGDNHNRIERHTFLGYGHYGGQYVWYVSLSHAARQHLDPKDWRRRTPYLRERVIRHQWNQPQERWLKLDQRLNGQWEILPVDQGTAFGQVVMADRARTERAYRKFERAETGRTRPLSVRDGKTTLTDDAAVLRIAALLDVSQPAKAVRMSKTQREVTV